MPSTLGRGLKAYGTKAEVEGHLPLHNEPVAILEDVVTTGDSLLGVIDRAEANGCTVTHAIAIVDRKRGWETEDRGPRI